MERLEEWEMEQINKAKGRRDGMIYNTDMVTGDCTCPDALYRDGSYDLGGAGRFCKHFLAKIGEAVDCPRCGGPIVFDRREEVPQYHCTNGPECVFSWRNGGIEARLILEMWRELRQVAKVA